MQARVNNLRTHLCIVRCCRGARPPLSVFCNGAVNARLRLNLTAAGNADMADHTHLPANHGILSNFGAPRNPRLGSDNGMLADLDIMRTLNQIIQLPTLPYNGRRSEEHMSELQSLMRI